jgi:hypothetical protein
MSDEELSVWYRQNTWVGRIQQVKAAKQDEVYVRIFYLYWPEELPKGRETYHGTNELVLSNHADIIDATSIMNEAEIMQLPDDEATVPPAPGQYYWRQTHNVKKVGKSLSTLPRYCYCHQEWNPDDPMFKCRHCSTYLHLGCLKAQLLNEIEQRRLKGSHKSYLDQRAQAWARDQEESRRSLGESFSAGAESLLNKVHELVHPHENGKHTGDEDGVAEEVQSDDENAALASRPKTPKEDSGKADGKFEAQVKEGADAVVAEVAFKPGKKSSAGMEKWELKLDCLSCNQPLD